MTAKKSTVIFRGTSVTFAYDETDCLTSLGPWVRSRFGIGSSTGLCYTCNDQEILPSISMLKSGIPIHVSTVEMDAKTLASDSASASASTPRLSAGSLSKLLTFNLYLFLLVLLNAISFAPYATGASSSVTEGIFKQLLSAFHVDSSTKKLLVEAYIASLCWGTTYLFVRRIWNPENAPISQALRKFAADAVFGGLAAGAAVIMKSLLVRVLV